MQHSGIAVVFVCVVSNHFGLAAYPQPKGAKSIVATQAVVSFLCSSKYESFYPSANIPRFCGNITFTQADFPDKRPVYVAACFDDLPEDTYEIIIHFTGDTTDNCATRAGRTYHKLITFTVARPTTTVSPEQQAKCEAFEKCLSETEANVCSQLLMDAGDPCATPPFTTAYSASYGTGFADWSINIRDVVGGILGRAVSLRNSKGNVLACDVIGMSGHHVYRDVLRLPILTVRNII